MTDTERLNDRFDALLGAMAPRETPKKKKKPDADNGGGDKLEEYKDDERSGRG